jgi:hypothetical protein
MQAANMVVSYLYLLLRLKCTKRKIDKEQGWKIRDEM